MNRVKTGVALMLAGVVFVLNPAYLTGCDPTASSFEFEESDMEANLTSAQTYVLKTTDRGEFTVKLDLRKGAGEPVLTSLFDAIGASAFACGTRSFFNEAAACVDVSTMTIAGSVEISHKASGADASSVITTQDLSGYYSVHGTKLSNGDMLLKFDGGEVGLDSRDGKTFTLVRFQGSDLGDDKLAVELSASCTQHCATL